MTIMKQNNLLWILGRQYSITLQHGTLHVLPDFRLASPAQFPHTRKQNKKNTNKQKKTVTGTTEVAFKVAHFAMLMRKVVNSQHVL